MSRRDFPRLLASSVELSMTDTPVALVVGPRQAGKSTLAEWIGREALGDTRHVTLDDLRTLAAARSDPTAFVEAGDDLLVIDEIQRAPELMLAIKASVDRDRRPGRFLLTGSANVLTLPTVSESLAGRVEILTLWPLSQLEIEGHEDADVVSRLFDPGARAPAAAPIDRPELIDRVLRGGFPPVVQRPDRRRGAWLANYLTTLVQRDVRDIANIAGATDLPRLLRALALRMTQPLNKSGLAATLGMPYSTLDRYLGLLMLLYAIQPIPAWHSNHGKRLTKASKLLVADSGLAAHLLAADAAAFERGTADFGAAAEAFVGMELVRLAGLDPVRATVHHYRTRTGAEIDFLLEAPDGRVVGVEVKAGVTVGAGDFRHLAALRDALGERFVRGVVLHLGEGPLPFGDRLAAWPISALWSAG